MGRRRQSWWHCAAAALLGLVVMMVCINVYAQPPSMVRVVDQSGHLLAPPLPDPLPARAAELQQWMLRRGDFASVAILQSSDRWVVVVDPIVKIVRVDMEGHDADAEAVVRDALTAPTRVPLPESEVREGVATRVLESLRAKGWLGAAATLRTRPAHAWNERVLRVQLALGQRARLARVVYSDEIPPRFLGSVPAPGDALDAVSISKRLVEAISELRGDGYYEAKLAGSKFERTRSGRRVLRVDLHVGPRYQIQVDVRGVLSGQALLDEAKLSDESIDDTRLTALERQLRKRYAEEGFHAPLVQLTRVIGKHDAVLVLRARSGSATRVQRVKVTVVGAPTLEASATAAFLAAAEASQRERFVDPLGGSAIDRVFSASVRKPRQTASGRHVASVYRPAAFSAGVDAALAKVRADGFWNARLEKAKLSGVGSKHVFSIEIDAGIRTQLVRTTFVGELGLSRHTLIDALAWRRGIPLSSSDVDAAQRRVRHALRAAGFYFASVTANLEWSTDRTRASVRFEVVAGPQVRVADVLVSGARTTNRQLILANVGVRNSDALTPAALQRARNRLQELGQFRSVTVSVVDEENVAPNKSVQVIVSERKRQAFDAGASLSTGQGARVDLEYVYRNVGGAALDCGLRGAVAWQLLFFDNVLAERFERLSVLDRLERRLGASCHVPYLGLPVVRAGLSLQHQRENERNFGLDANLVRLDLDAAPLAWLDLRARVSLEMNRVSLLLDDTSYDALLDSTNDVRLRRILRVPEGQSTLFAVGVGADADFRDSPFVPTRGIYASVDVEFASTIDSELVQRGEEVTQFFSNHIRTRALVSGYVPLWWGWVFAAQVQAGRVFHLQPESATYPNRRYFLGGASTIRGYLEDAMAPQDIADQAGEIALAPSAIVQGGDVYAVIRMELRIPLVSYVGMGIFADFGNVWADGSAFDLFRLRPSVGLGLRIASPFGPIAFDYGFLLSRRENLGEQTGAFHFSIGLF